MSADPKTGNLFGEATPVLRMRGEDRSGVQLQTELVVLGYCADAQGTTPPAGASTIGA